MEPLLLSPWALSAAAQTPDIRVMPAPYGVHSELISDPRSRDGLAPDLFPLTAEEQKKFKFRLAASELKAAFFYKRVLSISMTNADFRRADVTREITNPNDAK